MIEEQDRINKIIEVVDKNRDNIEESIFVKIIEILEQDGEEVTDGECINQIVNLLQENGYKIFNS